MQKLKKSIALGVLLAVTAGSLSACSGGGEGAAVDKVRTYVEAVAKGDAKLAHEANPYSPILTADGIKASKGGEHLEVVEIGSFESVDAELKTPDLTPAPETPKGDDNSGKDELTGIDWNDKSWTGLESDGGDELDGVDKDEISQGVVPVTVELDGEEMVIPLGIAFGKDETGKEHYEFRSFALSEEQAAKYGTPSSVPALAAASVELATIQPEDATPDDEQSRLDNLLEGTGEKAGEAKASLADAPIVRTGTVSGSEVELSNQEPLLLLPGSYKIEVGDPDGDALWASEGTPEPMTAVLRPGDLHTVELAEPTVTSAGETAAQEQLTQLAKDKFEALTTFPVSDRQKECGILAPGGGFSSKSEFEDDWFTTASTNIANGAVSVGAVSSNGAQGTVLGNGSNDTFADEAFCSGLSQAGGTSYSTPVKVLSSTLTPGAVTVEADGTLKTSTPWTFAITTEVTTFASTDAAGQSVGFGEAPVSTTYTATVNITWSPSGQLTTEGEVTPTESDEDK